MKIAVIGPGAMGLLFGSYLSQHHDVTLVGTNPAKMQSITENGVTIREMDGSERIYRPPCYRRHHRPLPRHHPDDPAKRYGPRNLAEPFRRP